MVDGDRAARHVGRRLAARLNEVGGIVHFCVPNLPAAAARSSTLALTNAVLPYLLEVADKGFEGAVRAHPDLRRGVYLHDGGCTRESLARAFGLSHVRWPGEGSPGPS